MSIPDEKIGMEKAPSPSEHPRRSLSSSEGTRNVDSYLDEKSKPVQERTSTGLSITSQPNDGDVEAAKPQGPAPGSPEANYQPKSLKFWLILLSAFVSMFLVALDRTIIATAIPTITDDFKSLNDIGWYGASYMLTTASFQLVWGRIYRFYDLRVTFLCCIVIFEVGSAICGAAPNSPVFIVGRAIAGVGSAGITTGSLLTTIPMIPLPKRPIFQSIFGMVFGVASISGPLLGGAFTERVTWRWCFYLNLPVGAVAFVFMFFFLRLPQKPQPPATVFEQIRRLDPLGTFFFVPSIVCLLLALQWGGSTYPWSNWRIILLFIMFGLAGIAFAIVQIKMPKTASLPPKVITQRTMLSGTFYMFFMAGAMMLCIYYLPLWFQTTHGISPVKSGIYTLPLVMSLIVAVIMSGILTQKTGYYVPSLIIGPSIMAIGEGLLFTFKPDTGSSHWIAYQFLTGYGLGFGFQTVNLAIQSTLPKEEIPTGIAIIFFAQQLGGAIFVSVGQTILSTLLVSRLSNVPGLDATEIIKSGATELVKIVPAAFLPTVISAYNYACTRIFLAALCSDASKRCEKKIDNRRANEQCQKCAPDERHKKIINLYARYGAELKKLVELAKADDCMTMVMQLERAIKALTEERIKALTELQEKIEAEAAAKKRIEEEAARELNERWQ
ncbi:efflux pump antibiotic resistance [Trichoderma arundinaceum]|uniref:Efflux pump antibiotic resistance n=1 Tax=Trichoderma arundinaceum TaxID=490622 RepID=A0A395NHJ2_TRIAR|nr:efflux pump antibiotic resistance [Trichoderma arundinaceum]